MKNKQNTNLKSSAIILISILCITAFIAGCSGAGNSQPSPASQPAIEDTRLVGTATPASNRVAPLGSPPPEPVSFPKDDAPHKNQTEWWYYNGHLNTNKGASYGFHFVIFQRYIEEGRAAYVGHFSITDINKKTFVYDQKLELGYIPQAADGTVSIKVGDWTINLKGGRDSIKANLNGYNMQLELTGIKRPVLHGGDGYITVAQSEESYYYSRTRMAVLGYLAVDGVQEPVVGSAWFDHQWGDFALQGGGGWDWYAIQLSDVTDVMISVIRGPDGRMIESYGTYVEQNGSAVPILQENIIIQPTGQWTSPRTSAKYPMGWKASIRSQGLDLTLTPVIEDQELDTRDSTQAVYWEGKVNVEGTKNGQKINGVGFVEMTGYAPR